MSQEIKAVAHFVKELESKGDFCKTLSYETDFASAEGDSYISKVLRLKLRVELGTGHVEERYFVCKCLSNEEKIRTMFSNVFKTEIKVLSEILPEMEKIILMNSPGEERFYPKCISYIENTAILIEDLKPLGYTLAGYRIGLDFKHCSLVLKTLGKLHALGALFIEQGKLNPEDYYHYKFEKAFVEFTSVFTRYANYYASQAVNVWKGEWLEYGERLKKAVELILVKLKETYTRNDSRFNTFLHGDCRNANTMFRYDGEENVVCARLLDWQLCWYNTGGFDVNYFLWTSSHVDAMPRKAELIQIYHESLSRSLSQCGYTKSPPTLDEVQADCERTALFGFATSISFLQFMMLPPAERITDENGKDILNVFWDLEGARQFTKTLQYVIKEAADIGLI